MCRERVRGVCGACAGRVRGVFGACAGCVRGVCRVCAGRVGEGPWWRESIARRFIIRIPW